MIQSAKAQPRHRARTEVVLAFQTALMAAGPLSAEPAYADTTVSCAPTGRFAFTASSAEISLASTASTDDVGVAGYHGRTSIAEILTLTDEIRELITAREPIRKINDAARRNGTRFPREAALDAVRKGRTTLQEIDRVTFVA